ncbi:MAG: DedA family protein [Bacteroidaceae bacterium]|nr:DedA family protein [Bacteroidaceae bacterium]
MTAEIIRWVLENLDYWVVLFFMAVESSFIPFPSEVVVPPAAWLSMASDSMNIFLVVVAATVGADVGALINYFLARYLGRPVIYRFAESRLGHLCLLDRSKVEQAEAYFRRHGATSTFFGRLVPAVRQLISIPAGIAKMPVSRFLIFTTLGAATWNTILALIGWGIYRFSSVKTVDEVYLLAKQYNTELSIAILLLVALAIGILFFKARKK